MRNSKYRQLKSKRKQMIGNMEADFVEMGGDLRTGERKGSGEKEKIKMIKV